MRPRPLPRLLLLIALFSVVAPIVRVHGPARVTTARAAGASPGSILNGDRLELLAARASRSAELIRTRQVRPAPGPMTGWWGERRRGHIHTGIDINGETGDPVVAAMSGTVSHAGPAVKGYTGYGNMVTIDHAGFQTVYAHLSRIDVAVGQVLRPGQLLGAIGTSGYVTGSHLHFEVRVGGEPVDPRTYLRVL